MLMCAAQEKKKTVVSTTKVKKRLLSAEVLLKTGPGLGRPEVTPGGGGGGGCVGQKRKSWGIQETKVGEKKATGQNASEHLICSLGLCFWCMRSVNTTPLFVLEGGSPCEKGWLGNAEY